MPNSGKISSSISPPHPRHGQKHHRDIKSLSSNINDNLAYVPKGTIIEYDDSLGGRHLVADKDYKMGEVIFEELPLAIGFIKTMDEAAFMKDIESGLNPKLSPEEQQKQQQTLAEENSINIATVQLT